MNLKHLISKEMESQEQNQIMSDSVGSLIINEAENYYSELAQ